jgi:hypothetical protein
MEWFYADGQNRVGPVSEEALREVVMSGKVTADTLVWHEGMSEWQPYGTVADQVGKPAVSNEPLASTPTSGGSVDPYAAPESSLHEERGGGPGGLLPSPRSNGAGAALRWWSWGWDTFKADAGNWVVTGIIIFAVLIGLNIIPIIGPIIGNVLYFLMLSGFFLMASAADRGESISAGDVFQGFSHRPGAILAVLGIYLGAMFVGGFGIAAIAGVGGGEQGVVIGIVILVILMIPLGMAVGFTPALLSLHTELGVAEAMQMSFFGCLKNILPFIVWGLLMIPLAIPVILTCGLGYLVLIPVMMLSMYKSYKDVFLEVA